MSIACSPNRPQRSAPSTSSTAPASCRCARLPPATLTTDLFLQGKSDAQIEQLTKLAPLERLGQPDDIAGVVSFLAGPDGAWVNGQVLRANGGFV